MPASPIIKINEILNIIGGFSGSHAYRDLGAYKGNFALVFPINWKTGNFRKHIRVKIIHFQRDYETNEWKQISAAPYESHKLRQHLATKTIMTTSEIELFLGRKSEDRSLCIESLKARDPLIMQKIEWLYIKMMAVLRENMWVPLFQEQPVRLTKDYYIDPEAGK